jgi:hypothetical protein
MACTVNHSLWRLEIFGDYKSLAHAGHACLHDVLKKIYQAARKKKKTNNIA